MRWHDKIIPAIFGVLVICTIYSVANAIMNPSGQPGPLPVYPGAQYVTVDSKLHMEFTFPKKGPLTADVAWPVHKYITLRAPGSSDQVLAWYRQHLTAAGWQYDPGPGDQRNVWKYTNGFSFLDVEASGTTESQVVIWEGGDAFPDGVPPDTTAQP